MVGAEESRKLVASCDGAWTDGACILVVVAPSYSLTKGLHMGWTLTFDVMMKWMVYARDFGRLVLVSLLVEAERCLAAARMD